MIKLLIAILILLPELVWAFPSNPCIKTDSSIDINMMDAMEQDMKIDMSTILRDKTASQLIENSPVNDVLAKHYAVKDEKKSPDRWLSVKDYTKIYLDSEARNLIVKFTYENDKGKHNVFFVSAIVNNSECSIRFNGYIIAQREF